MVAAKLWSLSSVLAKEFLLYPAGDEEDFGEAWRISIEWMWHDDSDVFGGWASGNNGMMTVVSLKAEPMKMKGV